MRWSQAQRASAHETQRQMRQRHRYWGVDILGQIVLWTYLDKKSKKGDSTRNPINLSPDFESQILKTIRGKANARIVRIG